MPLRAKNWCAHPRVNIHGIGGITLRLFCELKDVLAIVNQFSKAVYLVESDQISQRSHARVSQR